MDPNFWSFFRTESDTKPQLANVKPILSLLLRVCCSLFEHFVAMHFDTHYFASLCHCFQGLLLRVRVWSGFESLSDGSMLLGGGCFEYWLGWVVSVRDAAVVVVHYVVSVDDVKSLCLLTRGLVGFDIGARGVSFVFFVEDWWSGVEGCAFGSWPLVDSAVIRSGSAAMNLLNSFRPRFTVVVALAHCFARQFHAEKDVGTQVLSTGW